MSSIIKVNTVQDTDGNNIINENANTITIGASGDTISIPAGATLANSGTATGFASIAWQSAVKTANFTAVAGEGYFVNTSGGAFEIDLPTSPSVTLAPKIILLLFNFFVLITSARLILFSKSAILPSMKLCFSFAA